MKANYGRIIYFSTLYMFLLALNDASSGKADEMCKKYGDSVFVEEEAPVMLPVVKKNMASQCGIVEVPLIVGGERAGPKQFPHMVALGFGGSSASETKWMCGGALISEQYVLTAAHCLNSSDMGEVRWARTGDTGLHGTNDDANAQIFSVVKRIAHPDFKPPAVYHDIALVNLQPDVKFDAYTRPACLNTQHQLQETTATASGFGQLAYESPNMSPDLLKVDLHIWTDKKCNESFDFEVKGKALPKGVIESQLCAGEEEGGKDTCQGDSGGPLQIVLDEPYCMYSIIGITSFGKFCGMPNSPAVYTRVSHFISWIENIVWP